MTSKPHISLTDETVARLLRRRKLGSYYMNDVRFLDSRIKLLEEEVTGLKEQLEAERSKVEVLQHIVDGYPNLEEQLEAERERREQDVMDAFSMWQRGRLSFQESYRLIVRGRASTPATSLPSDEEVRYFQRLEGLPESPSSLDSSIDTEGAEAGWTGAPDPAKRPT